MARATLSINQIQSCFFVSVAQVDEHIKNVTCKFQQLFEFSNIFQALMEISFNLLELRHILMRLRLEWQITKKKRSQLAAQVPQGAQSRLN